MDRNYISKKDPFEKIIELKSMITEVKKNILQGFHSRFKMVEERISEPEVTAVEITQYEEQKEKI